MFATTAKDGGLNKFLKHQKDHILLGKEAKLLDKFRGINRIQVNHGSGRIENNLNDTIVITRKLNHPELIFN